jgi:hypothetical protein
MDGLVNDGFIILGGPVGDGEETLHVVEASDEDEIRTRLAADPWAEARLLRIGMIEPGLCGWTADRTNWGLDLRLIASLRGQLRTFTHSAAGNYALSRALI